MPEKPIFSAALMCTEILEEKDGNLSVIRLVDKLSVVALGEDAPKDATPTIQVMLLILFKSVPGYDGRHVLEITPVTPSGRRLKLKSPVGEEAIGPTLNFPGGTKTGLNVQIRLVLTLEGEGLYWVEVSLDGQLCTRLPLLVEFQKQPPKAQPQGQLKQET